MLTNSSSKIWLRLILIGIIISLIWWIAAYILISFQVDNAKNEKYTEVSKEIKNELKTLIKEKEEAVLLVAFAMSQNSKMIEALIHNDTSSLNLQEFTLKLREHTTLKHIWFQVITAEGNSFYRSWTDKKGDHLADVRADVAKMIESPKVISSISTGKFDLTFKSMVPIYHKGEFIGSLEALAKFNSISLKMQKLGYDNVIIVDEKYKNQLTYPFTKIFIDDYYVANLNAKEEHLVFIKNESVKNLIDVENYYIDKEKKELISVYKLPDINNKPMSYFILFHQLNKVDMETSIRVRDRLLLFFSITYLFILLALYYIYIRQYRGFIEAMNSHLENKVKEKTIELEDKSEKLSHLANHDSLTSLPNRMLFTDRLNQSIKHASRTKTSISVLFLDLDRFKEVNDTYGHDAGDELLCVITKRLQKCVRKEDTIARLGGDEFTIILNNLTQRNTILVLDKIINVMKEGFKIKNHLLYSSFSIGASTYPQDGETSDLLLRNADTAMYKAKDNGKNGYQFYNVEMTRYAQERVQLETKLREAIENEEFRIFFQPKFNTRSEKIIGMEALIRWENPVLGLVPPDRFIPLAEEIGLIVKIDEWMMKNAIKKVIKWKKMGLETGMISLNLSVYQLESSGFLDNLKNILQESNFDTSCLELEITESQIMKNPYDSIEILSKIRDLGITISVDDFGTGYSSLSYLKRLPIDKLKIDRCFVIDAHKNDDDAAIVRAIIALAKSLKLDIIAEGVEIEEQKEFLLAEGCNKIQGYLYSRPLDEDAFEEFLIKHSS